LISLFISLSVSLFAWRRRNVVGATPYVWITLAQASWTLGNIFELLSPELDAKVFWDNIQFIGFFVIPLAFLGFALEYTGRILPYPKFVWAMLFIVVLIFLLIVFTDNSHQLLRPDARLVPGDPFSTLDYTLTDTFRVMVFFNYGLIMSAVFVLLREFIKPAQFHRSQIGMILIGVLIPLIGSSLTGWELLPHFQRDSAPIAFALSNLILVWGIFHYRILNIVPVARGLLVEQMNDVVMVIDAQNRIIDINAAAQQVIDLPASTVIGQPVAQVFPHWSEVVAQHQDAENARREIEIVVKEEPRHFDLRISALYDRREWLMGRLVVARDITEQVLARRTLQRARDELEDRVEERTGKLAQANASLQETQGQLAAILDALPDWLFIMDTEGYLLDYRVPQDEWLYVPPEQFLGKTVGQVLPQESAAVIMAAVRETIESGRHTGAVYYLDHPDGRHWFEMDISAQGDLGASRGHLVALARNITDRRRMEQDLQQRVQELAALNLLNQRVSSELSLAQVVKVVIDEVVAAVQPDLALLYLREGDQLFLQAFGPSEANIIPEQFPVHRVGECLCGLAISEEAALYSSNIYDDSRCTWQECKQAGFTSFAALPLRSKGEIIGALGLASRVERDFAERANFLETLAGQVAVAMQNSLLHEQVQRYAVELEQRIRERTQDLMETNAQLQEEIVERTHIEATLETRHRLLQALHEGTLDIAELEMSVLLRRIIERAVSLIDTDRGGGIVLYHPDKNVLYLREFTGTLGTQYAGAAIKPDQGLIRRVIETKRPFIIDRYAAERQASAPPSDNLSLLMAPLLVRDQLLGVLVVGAEQHKFTENDVWLAEMFAAQAAIAIQNAQLYEQTKELAALQERQRLANDLHDAVSQTLYSARVVSETLLHVWKDRPDSIEMQLHQLHQLTKGAQAEMRTLLLELRPSALVEASLGGLLMQLADALVGRTQLSISMNVEEQVSLPVDVKIALYRIAQEALNNVAKHARATEVEIALHSHSGQTMLCVHDNGRGFDLNDISPGCLGVGIMHERASAVGAKLDVTSSIGQGTEVLVTYER
jgi:PAS domain S-box-containing protein